MASEPKPGREAAVPARRKPVGTPAVRTNKNGQQLGRKGIETRQRLMDATRQLLVDMSPFSLTALLVTKKARTAPATFYVYFDDMQDLLYVLCAETGGEMVDLFENDLLLRNRDQMDQDALAFVRAFNRVWDRHSNILLYRNLEADRGDARFDKLRTEAAIPTLDALAERLTSAYPAESRPRRAAIYAEAVVFFVALERLAAAVHQYPGEGLSEKDLMEAQARVLVRLLAPR